MFPLTRTLCLSKQTRLILQSKCSYFSTGIRLQNDRHRGKLCINSFIAHQNKLDTCLSNVNHNLSNLRLYSTSRVLACQPKSGIEYKGQIFANADAKQKFVKEKKEAKRLKQLAQQQAKAQATKKKDADVLYESSTPLGCKKDTHTPLPNAYSPKYVEAAWYEWWEKEGMFSPGEGDSEKKFVMVLPPPNVTGTLHLGHALGVSIQDALARWHKMSGHQVLWVPGCDHAGIATQVVVEKKLMAEGKSRHDIGREKFVEEVYRWKDEKGTRIFDQIKKLGASLDWQRSRFTLDPTMNRAVTEAFVRLHDEGLIYRTNRLINWSSALKSTISDIEVDNISLDGKTMLTVPGYKKKIPFGIMVYFKYPIEGSEETITVATTRPETMLGDTAIAVHPDDTRYTHLVGSHARHPFCDRTLPIIADEYVDISLGTGAVKLTPAHDHNDYTLGVKHSLLLISVINDEGNMENVPERYLGQKRLIVRNMIMKDLEKENLLIEVKDHQMAVPVCSRSGDIIEPRLKEQWYINCDEMARNACESVRMGQLRLHPQSYDAQWFNWLENNKDWCISRQLWWGHRIPAYRVADQQGNALFDQDGTSVWVSARTEDEAIMKASERLCIAPHELSLVQDEDVLDTWFSSALFPFSVFNWPDQTSDLTRFYPTSVLETGGDIIFFWVARMVMFGQKFMGQTPFSDVLFHGMLQDAHGRKMSKSLGNIIDPMDVIHGTSLDDLQERLAASNLSQAEITKAQAGQKRDFPLGIPQCGADALRFTMCSLSGTGHFVTVDVNSMKSNRNFCNKVWQAMRFTQQNLGADYTPPQTYTTVADGAAPTDKWILSCATSLLKSCDEAFGTYTLQIATKALQVFWKQQFCDVYLEYSKNVFQSGDETRIQKTKDILHLCTDIGLRALHPIMPFLTEELYQRIPKLSSHSHDSVSLASYPKSCDIDYSDAGVEEQMNHVQELSNHCLYIRRQLNLTKSKANVFVYTRDDNYAGAFISHSEALKVLSRSNQVILVDDFSEVPSGCLSDEHPNWTIQMQIKDLIDVEKESSRLSKQLEKLENEVKRMVTAVEKQETDNILENEEIAAKTSEIKKLESFIKTIKSI